jgi:hypothetical protein
VRDMSGEPNRPERAETMFVGEREVHTDMCLEREIRMPTHRTAGSPLVRSQRDPLVRSRFDVTCSQVSDADGQSLHIGGSPHLGPFACSGRAISKHTPLLDRDRSQILRLPLLSNSDSVYPPGTMHGSSFTQRTSKQQLPDVYFFLSCKKRSRPSVSIIRIMFQHGENGERRLSGPLIFGSLGT